MGVATALPIVKQIKHNFQYPRRIECGCGFEVEQIKISILAFQYPRRIECGCGVTRAP